MKMSRLWLLSVCLGLICFRTEAAERTKARLILSVDQARAGDTILAGVELRMPPKWHTYWRNAGDSGMATKIDWQLPDGISAGEIQWPVPEKLTASDLTTYVYHDSVVLLVPLKLTNGLAAGSLDLKAKVSWLECEEVCIPGGASVQAAMKVGSESKPSQEAALIEASLKKLPVNDPSLAARASWEKPVLDNSRPVIIEWEAKAKLLTADFFPLSSDDFELTGPTDRLNREGSLVALRKTVKKFGTNWPNEIRGLLVTKLSSDGPPQGYEAKLTLAAPDGKPADGGAKTPSAPVQDQPPKKSLWAMLGLAFLGGLILNVMPCVLPVIALKILGFVNQSQENPRRVRQLGVLYALGVMASFLVLAGVVIAVQKGGRVASWGMQFQNPQFLIGMTVLVTFVALNLFGLFEINLAAGAMNTAGNLASKEGESGAFFNGVLATALATPCTAPFLGVALGFAFAQSPAVIALMFLTVGLGLAAPYLVLSWQPGWLKFLPKPGVWMEKFKIAMGFPMLATAVWLFWLATSHFGRKGSLWIGLFLVTLSMAAWVWGEFVQRGIKHKSIGVAASLGLILLGYFYALEKELNWRSPTIAARSREASPNDADGIQWRAWNAKAVEEARAGGRPVLVDFTADWCLTCQVNKKTSLEIPAVQAKLKAINAVALLGDYTSEDPAIASELKQFGRAGVPLVLVYSPDLKVAAEVLPEVLTPNIVLEALNKVSSTPVATPPKADSSLSSMNK